MQVLGTLFSSKDSDLIQSNNALWSAFLTRFSDIDVSVRLEITKCVADLFLNHPSCRTDLEGNETQAKKKSARKRLTFLSITSNLFYLNRTCM